MQPFLYEVAEDILINSPELTNYCIVFPNKRTSAFFKKYYVDIQKKSTWAPNIFTIDSILKKISGINTLDKNTLLIDLYTVSKEVFAESQNSEYFGYYTFDKFFSIGEIILNDFNDIDNYLIDAKDLFRNIKSIEEIDLYYNYLTEEQKHILREFWLSFSIEKTSDEKQKFLLLWEKLPEIYDRYSKFLLSKKATYGGLRNRYITKLINTNQLNTNHFSKYIFVGFNALNKAEKALFKHLDNNKKAIFYWDYDNYYINDIKQEAGFFMRDNLKDYSNHYQQNKDLIKNHKNEINVIGVPLQVGQAKIINSILSELKNKSDDYFNDTAIILADEHLLFPVLHSLPNDIPAINITMGYPLKETTLYGLLIDYIQIQQNTASNKKSQTLFYYKDVIKILKHPEIWAISSTISELIIKDIEQKNRIYITTQYFFDYKNDLLNLIFTPVYTTENPVISLLNNMLNILFVIFNKIGNEAAKSIENEYIYQVYVEIKKLKDLFDNNKSKVDFNLNISIKLLKQILLAIRIPFTGEHSDGLQVMGLMETRNLDFKNIILLNVNEGVLPDTARKPSFISDNLRIAFQLPVIKFQDSIFAYFFYRLLQRAENIYLIYNSIIGNSNAEISRFVLQLELESGLKIEKKQFKQKLTPFLNKSISICKNEQILSYLSSYLTDTNLTKKHFSASALNTYLDCKLKFYFKYIALLKLKQEIEEEISPVTFGIILHYAIEKLYSDYLEKKQNKLIEQNDFVFLNTQVENYTEKAFKNYYQISDNSKFKFEGTNIIIKDVVETHLRNILQTDSKYAPFKIIDLEQKFGYNAHIEVNINQNLKYASLWGVFDRIDFKDELYRIIDYKTGSTEKIFNSIESLFNPLNNSRKTAVFQMLYYTFILTQKFENYKGKILPGIYDIRTMSGNNFNPNLFYKPDRDTNLEVDSKVIEELLPEFETFLSNLISEIFNIEIDFIQTENQNSCTYCDYKQICSR